jgi:streptogramin lyase
MQARGRRRERIGAVALLALAVLLLPAAADARPRLAGVFDLSGTPGQIAKGPDGNVWVTISGSGDNSTLARITPGGNVTEYEPANLVNPVGITSGPDGNLWFTRNGGVVRVDPDDPKGSNQDFDIAAISDPREIIRGPGGNLWTASGDQLVSIPTADPAGFDALTIEGDAPSARGIANSDNKLFVADFGDKRIVRVTPGGGQKSFNVGGPGGPQDVTRGARGSVAYTNQGTDPHTVGRILRGSNRARRTKVPNTDPFGITFAKDGNWWIANFASDNLTILDRGGDDRRFRGLPDGSGPRWIAKGPQDTLWVSLEGSGQVARIKGVKR